MSNVPDKTVKNDAFGLINPGVLVFDNTPAKLVIEGPLSYEAIAAIQVIASRDRRYRTDLDKITAEVERLRGLRDQWQAIVSEPDHAKRAQIDAAQYHEDECVYQRERDAALAEVKRLSALRWSAVGDALVPNDYMSPKEVGAVVDPLRAEVADYRRTLNFGIECISCAKTLEKLYEADAKVERLHGAVSAVEALCDEWDAYDAEGYAAGGGPPALARVEEIRSLLAEATS